LERFAEKAGPSLSIRQKLRPLPLIPQRTILSFTYILRSMATAAVEHSFFEDQAQCQLTFATLWNIPRSVLRQDVPPLPVLPAISLC
jgi:hypothetical protein